MIKYPDFLVEAALKTGAENFTSHHREKMLVAYEQAREFHSHRAEERFWNNCLRVDSRVFRHPDSVVFKLLRVHRGVVRITTREAARVMGVSRPTAVSCLRRMSDEGLIDLIFAKKGTWVIAFSRELLEELDGLR